MMCACVCECVRRRRCLFLASEGGKRKLRVGVCLFIASDGERDTVGSVSVFVVEFQVNDGSRERGIIDVLMSDD